MGLGSLVKYQECIPESRYVALRAHLCSLLTRLDIGVASYGALGHVPLPRLPTVYFLIVIFYHAKWQHTKTHKDIQ